jgi:hypothetical protein
VLNQGSRKDRRSKDTKVVTLEHVFLDFRQRVDLSLLDRIRNGRTYMPNVFYALDTRVTLPNPLRTLHRPYPDPNP